MVLITVLAMMGLWRFSLGPHVEARSGQVLAQAILAQGSSLGETFGLKLSAAWAFELSLLSLLTAN